jgi:phage/plasmid-like protein (TIGR03299 family)
MAHQIVGDSVFVTAVPAWHRIGKVFTEQEAKNLTWEDALRAAKADFNVVELPAYSYDERTGESYNVPSEKHLYREDTMQFLAAVGQGYQVLQNRDAFKFFDPIIESGQATFSTAGVLFDSRVIWAMASLNGIHDDEVVRGDRVEPFLLLTNSHDGRLAVTLKFTPVRVVCANTLEYSLSRGSSKEKFAEVQSGLLADVAGKVVKIHHTRNLDENLRRAQAALNIAHRRFEFAMGEYREMARCSVGINDETLEQFVRVVFKVKEEREIEKVQYWKSFQEALHTDQGLYLGQQTSWWTVYNAVTNITSHSIGKTDDRVCFNNWYDSVTGGFRERAHELVSKTVQRVSVGLSNY